MTIRKGNMLDILWLAESIMEHDEKLIDPEFISARRKAVAQYIADILAGERMIELTD